MCYVLSRFSRVQLFVTPWTVAHQTPLSMGFSRQEYWGGLPCSPSGDPPDSGLNRRLLSLLHWQVDSLPLVPPRKPEQFWYTGKMTTSVLVVFCKVVQPTYGGSWSGGRWQSCHFSVLSLDS